MTRVEIDAIVDYADLHMLSEAPGKNGNGTFIAIQKSVLSYWLLAEDLPIDTISKMCYLVKFNLIRLDLTGYSAYSNMDL